MASVEIFANIGDITMIAQKGGEVFLPHTFMQITGADGTITTVGFQPTSTGIVGPGWVKDNTRKNGDGARFRRDSPEID